MSGLKHCAADRQVCFPQIILENSSLLHASPSFGFRPVQHGIACVGFACRARRKRAVEAPLIAPQIAFAEPAAHSHPSFVVRHSRASDALNLWSRTPSGSGQGLKTAAGVSPKFFRLFDFWVFTSLIF